MELSDSIRDYVEKRITHLGKLLAQHEGEVNIDFEVSKTTNHHESGKIYRADCNVTMFGPGGGMFYSSSDQEDLYAAIDDVKDKIFKEVKRTKSRKQALWKKGATRLKSILKGLTKR